jgi:hypothetical protein
MKALARIDACDGSYEFPGLLLVDFGDNDVSKHKDEHGIVHLEYNGRLVIKDGHEAETA